MTKKLFFKTVFVILSAIPQTAVCMKKNPPLKKMLKKVPNEIWLCIIDFLDLPTTQLKVQLASKKFQELTEAYRKAKGLQDIEIAKIVVTKPRKNNNKEKCMSKLCVWFSEIYFFDVILNQTYNFFFKKNKSNKQNKTNGLIEYLNNNGHDIILKLEVYDHEKLIKILDQQTFNLKELVLDDKANYVSPETIKLLLTKIISKNNTLKVFIYRYYADICPPRIENNLEEFRETIKKLREKKIQANVLRDFSEEEEEEEEVDVTEEILEENHVEV